MSAISEFRTALREAPADQRSTMLKMLFFPYPTVAGNIGLYIGILFQLTVVFGVVGAGLAFGFPKLAALWGDVAVVRFILGAVIADVLITLTLNRISGSLLKGVQARKEYETRLAAAEVRKAMQAMFTNLSKSGDMKMSPLTEREAEDFIRGLDRAAKAPANPVKNALEHLEAQDRAMDEQEQNIKKIHEDSERPDPIRHLLDQLEAHDRKLEQLKKDEDADDERNGADK